ncbi:MAG: hypothetical protein M5U14_00955 [Acidimicrobiia bacterium]|nr:hypothetical protein [Acidimicrobiia bacterium]
MPPRPGVGGDGERDRLVRHQARRRALLHHAPADGFTRVDPARTQARVDAGPAREPAGPFEGEATVEATAVVHDRDGAPTVAIVTLLTPDGRRALANSRDPDALASMVSEAWEGRPVEVRTDGATNTLV